MKNNLIFREVYIGGIPKIKLVEKLNENNIGLNEFALRFINHKEFTTSSCKEKLQTVETTVCDLGFPEGATVEEICKKAAEFEFKMCPHELALHMRLQYMDPNQPIDPPKGNWQNIIVNDLSDELEFTHGFYLRHHEDGFWLRGYRASLDYLWDPADRFIFVKG